MKENKDLIDSVENKYIDQIKYHQDDITGYKKSFEWLNSCLDNLAKFYNIRYTTDALKEAGVNEAGESVIRDLINHTIQALIDFREERSKEMYRSEGRIQQLNSTIKDLHKSHEDMIKKEVRSKVITNKIADVKRDMDKRRKARSKKKEAIKKPETKKETK